MKQHLLFAALAATLFAAPAHAVRINDQAFVANGGDMANVQGTAANVFDALRTASMAPQFLPSGRVGNCEATWLGVQGDYGWVLTSARCVSNTTELVKDENSLSFTTHDGTKIAGAPHKQGSLSFIHPNRINKPAGVQDAGSDIALLRMKILGETQHFIPLAPTLYDGTAELGRSIGFVTHGPVSVGNVPIAGWPGSGVRRAWGESRVDGTNDASHALFANFTTGSATHWAIPTSSEAGGAWWQQQNGHWQVVATTSSSTILQSKGVRVSKYATWINDLFPLAQLGSEGLSSEVAEITDTKYFRSEDLGGSVGFVKSDGQPDVVAPDKLISEDSQTGDLYISVPVTNTETGVVRNISLRASREMGCRTVQMHNALSCYPNATKSQLLVVYDDRFSPALPHGTWRGRVSIDALTSGKLNNTFVRRFDLDIDLAVAPTKGAFELTTANNATPTHSAYFTIPNQSAATGPTSGHSSTATGYSTITVQARDALRQTIVPVKLRAQRVRPCGAVAMNNAYPCGTDRTSSLKVWFDPIDNPTLQPGTKYSVKFNVQARTWGSTAVNKTFPVNFHLDLL